MPDHLTPEKRSLAMKSVKLKNGPLEMAVQKELHKKGLRFQINVRQLPGSPDIVFKSERVAIFIDGDFWHGWRFPVWEKKLSSFWRNKISTNRKRDQRNSRILRSGGWKVIRIWEHQLKRNIDDCIRRITILF